MPLWIYLYYDGTMKKPQTRTFLSFPSLFQIFLIFSSRLRFSPTDSSFNAILWIWKRREKKRTRTKKNTWKNSQLHITHYILYTPNFHPFLSFFSFISLLLYILLIILIRFVILHFPIIVKINNSNRIIEICKWINNYDDERIQFGIQFVCSVFWRCILYGWIFIKNVKSIKYNKLWFKFFQVQQCTIMIINH